MFIDETTLTIISGKGGDGAVCFRHEKYMEKGGPSGGNGGNGGSIIFVADINENTLLPLRYLRKIQAEHGENGKIKNMTGKSGEDKIIKVPLGTMIFDQNTNKLLCDLTVPGEQKIVLKGGKGGRGNATFATSRNQAPKFAEPGEPSKELFIRLELKVLADVGFVGYPSVGKSTLVSVISDAKPKIAAYHFTTLQPNLGMVLLKDGRSFVCADLPGLIEGASTGLGLGIQFLKHVERTKVILHILDGDKPDGNLYQDYKVIRNELKMYDENILDKGEIIVINKNDSDYYEDNKNNFIEDYKADNDGREPEFISISAMFRENLDELLYKTMDLLEAEKEKEVKVVPIENVKEYTFVPNQDKGFEVGKDYENLVYTVTGEKIDELLRWFDPNSDESVMRFARALRKLGVEEELKNIGAIDGDLVRIGDIEFEFNE